MLIYFSLCVCVFLLLNAQFHLNIIGLFACHFPSSHIMYNKLHRLALWVTEAFIKIRMIPDENIFCWKSRFHADYTPNIQHADINRHISAHWFMNTLIVVKMIPLCIRKPALISVSSDKWFQYTSCQNPLWMPLWVIDMHLNTGHIKRNFTSVNMLRKKNV